MEDFRTRIFDAIERNATDLNLAKMCREEFQEASVPKRGKQWTMDAFETAQSMIYAGHKPEEIAQRLTRLYVGEFTANMVKYQIYNGALHRARRGAP